MPLSTIKLLISNPLIIEIGKEYNRLQIKNDYDLKKVVFANGQGLENIAKRYELIWEKINVAITNDKFIVEVPIL